MPGLNGAGIVYLGKAGSGREFLFVRHDHDANAGTDPKNLFLARSTVVNGIRSNTAGYQLAEIVNYSNLMETPDEGLLDADGYITLDNAPVAASFTRLWDGTIQLFAIKGTNITSVPTNKNIVTAGNLDAWISGTLSSTTTGTTTTGTIVTGEAAKTLVEQAQDFATQNPALTILIVLGLVLLLIWLYNQYFKKKGRKRRR